MGTISDRRASNGDFPAAHQSGNSSYSAWFPRVAATDSFCKFLFSAAPCPQWTLHFDGSPAALLEPSLHAKLGVDAFHAARSAHGPPVDGEGRRPLHFPAGSLARIPAHRGHGASVAFPFGLRIPA